MPPTLSGRSDLLTAELQSLSEWARQLWVAFNALPTMSLFSGVSPNLSHITGVQGDLVINVANASSNTVVWVMAGVGSASSTSGWRAVSTVPY